MKQDVYHFFMNNENIDFLGRFAINKFDNVKDRIFKIGNLHYEIVDDFLDVCDVPVVIVDEIKLNKPFDVNYYVL